jgi:hypothetical protein
MELRLLLIVLNVSSRILGSLKDILNSSHKRNKAVITKIVLLPTFYYLSMHYIYRPYTLNAFSDINAIASLLNVSGSA